MVEATVNTEEGALRLNKELTEARTRIAALEAQLAKALNRVVLEDDGGAWQADDIGHPRHSADTRDEIELFIRDAYASGCRAAQNRSLLTAVEYASRHAPELRRRLTALEATPPAPKVTDEVVEAALKAFHSVGRYASEKARMEAALTAAQEEGR